MTELLTAAQMRALEAAAIASGEVTGLELMERAGAGVVAAVLEEWPDLALTAHRAVILCGPGNNGGDGFVVARLLRERGWDVVVFLYGDAERLPPDARVNYDRWAAMGRVHPFTADKVRDLRLCDPHPDLWVDAIFGVGQTRPLPPLVTQMMHRVYYEQNWCTAPVVAVDIPTGIASDTGQSLQTFHLSADLTVTFHAMKTGHVTADGPDRCGKIVVCDIGLPAGQGA
jgi:hydroxyethylthiazole kinase-like uncharacterized protein yjeF